MCRHVEAQFAPQLSSVGAARALVGAQLEQWDLDDPDGSIMLLVSELVTNAVRHTGTPVEFSMAVADGTVEIGVADSDPRVIAHLRHDESGRAARAAEWQSERGRGLFLVDAIADEWGTEQLVAGKQVWFRLAAGERWRHRTDCPCHGTDLHQAIRLGSGRHVISLPDARPNP